MILAAYNDARPEMAEERLTLSREMSRACVRTVPQELVNSKGAGLS